MVFEFSCSISYQNYILVFWLIPFQVNYINAHATSTIVGDLAEVNAVKKVFKSTSEIKMNATKVKLLSLSIDFFAIPQSRNMIFSCFFINVLRFLFIFSVGSL